MSDYDDSHYSEKQIEKDQEYKDAWASAPASFKAAAAAMGMNCDIDSQEALDVHEYDDNVAAVLIVPDMSATLDAHVDFIVEKYAGRVDPMLVRNIAEDLAIPMHKEEERNKADLLGRIAGNLIYMEREKGNISARIHALIHAIPRYAREAGFTSMRASARVCRVSPEWLRRKRDQWCVLLGIEPPEESTKTETAKQKYTDNANTNHWRHQKYKHGKKK